MKIGPKYKIAKRLGAPIFEKTQTQKFALSQARGGRQTKRGGQMSDFKRQLIEKQKMRFTYCITEKQLRRYVDEAVSTTGHQPVAVLMNRLESRLDNVVYRLGLAKIRLQARQLVSHGHILVNGRRNNVPSHKTKVGDVISIREGSQSSALFLTLKEADNISTPPNWLSLDVKKLSATIAAAPVYNPTETLFDPDQVMEFYSR